MRLRPWLLGSAGVIALLGLIVVAGLWWAYATASGARFVVARLLQSAGGAVSVEAIDGSLRDSLELRGLRYRDSAQTVQIDSLALSLGLSGLLSGSIEIEDLRSSVVEYRALAAGTEPEADGGDPPVSVPVRLSFGRVSIAGVSVDRGDAEPLVVNRITLSGSVVGSRASLQRFETRWQGFFLSSQGNVSWNDGVELNGILSWSGQFRDRSWLGSVALQGRWPELTLEQELLEPFAQTASGTLTLTEAPSFAIDVAAAGVGMVTLVGRYEPAAATLELMLAGSDLTPGVVVEGWPGTLAVDGSFTARIAPDYRIATDDLSVTATTDATSLGVDFAGAFDASRTLAVDRLEAAIGGNRVRINGEIGSRLDLSVEAELDDLAELADLGDAPALGAWTEFRPALTALRGRAAAELQISGTPGTPQISGEASVADAVLAGLPLSLRAEFSAAVPLDAPGGPSVGNLSAVELDAFDASLGATRLTASGTVGAGALGPAGDAAAIDLRLNASFGDLGELAMLSEREDVRALTGLDAAVGELAGSSEVSVTIRGTRSRPAIVADLNFAQVDAGLPWTADGRLQTTLEPYEGGQADFSLAATTEAFDVDVTAVGALADGGWRGQVRSLEIDEHVLGSWLLERPTAVAFAPGRVSLEQTCLVNGGSEVCARWQTGGADDGLRLQSEAFELATLDPLLPATMSLGGRVAIDLDVRSLAAEPAANLSIGGDDLSLVVELSDTDTVTTEFETVTIDAALDDYALMLTAGLRSPTAGRANLSIRSADVRDREASIDGRVEIFWPDLGALSLLSPDVGEVGGILNVAITLAGTADEPAMAGTAALRDGRIAIPEWDVLVERIEAEALSFDGGSLEFTGSGFVEDSEISISGATELDPEAGWPTRLSLSGENVPVSRRPDAMVYASPDFDVEIELPRIDVSGSVFVPEARIAVEELPAQAVRVSPDSVVHGMTEVEPVRPLELTAEVAVELGDDVRYSGSNLDTKLSGMLRLRYESGLSPTASGSLRLDGSYDAYGQSLELARGELLFAGPLDDPAIDVRAVRRIGSTTVGIDLTGTLLAPNASVFSEPSMSEANALSYLMFGRPLSATSDDEETATLESTALALGLQQALPGIQRVGQTIGLDELSIAANDVDAGALMAGKYLSPKLYMSYTYGLFNRLGGFLLRYEINDRLALETRSGSEKSMDLLYSIEKE